jgi:micrococcal nuclease
MFVIAVPYHTANMKYGTLAAILTVGLAACTGTETTASTTPGIAAHVVKVLDGDSLIVDIDGIQEKIRLIGVNAPEHDECYGRESATRLRDLLDDTDITVATDIEARDQYGRLLAYVYRDGVLINEEVAFRGLVLARAYEPNTAYQEQIDRAADEARESQSGMWAPSACASASGANIAIIEIEANPSGPDEDNLNGEWVVIANTGDSPIDLTGWTLRDTSSVHRYSLSRGTILDGGKDLFIFTGCGEGDADGRYWCADGPVWGNSGDSAILLDADGRMAATFDY